MARWRGRAGIVCPEVSDLRLLWRPGPAVQSPNRLHLLVAEQKAVTRHERWAARPELGPGTHTEARNRRPVRQHGWSEIGRRWLPPARACIRRVPDLLR